MMPDVQKKRKGPVQSRGNFEKGRKDKGDLLSENFSVAEKNIQTVPTGIETDIDRNQNEEGPGVVSDTEVGIVIDVSVRCEKIKNPYRPVSTRVQP
ncbi:hypothetical protein EVAR_33022_1 [Eumeta japonica]|uniref:Uncharacterized protein n=1 Tax=Eumeta variegata TaxID=151549 RepID=A0A4C1VTY5_EUMVA|nr:hypothetical protein EVAR_33022_1 [Eumeta japonica]